MNVGPRIGVLALQGDVREHVAALITCGAQSFALRSVSELASVDGLVIPGGESTTMSRLAVIDGFLEPLRNAQAAGLPMYGTCAGMIMLADRLQDGRPDQETIGGLDVTVRRNAFGRQVDSFEVDVQIPSIGDAAFPAVFIRAPEVCDIGPEVEVLATIRQEQGDGTIVAVRQGSLMATAFHPELTGDPRIHQMFVTHVRQLA